MQPGQSNQLQGSISSNSGARGRIAQVLASARASLKEPSRPFTPQSLDQRTALDMGLSSSIGSSQAAPSASNSRMRIHNSITASLRTGGGTRKSTRHQTQVQQRSTSEERGDFPPDDTSRDPCNLAPGRVDVSQEDVDKFRLVLHDISDAVSFAEHSLLGYAVDAAAQAEGAAGHDSSPFDGLAHNIDRLAKLIKTDAAVVAQCK